MALGYPPLGGRPSRSACFGPDAVQQLGAGDEGYPEARSGKDNPGVSRIALHVVDAAFDRPHCNGIGHQIRLQAGLDDEQAADFPKHGHG